MYHQRLAEENARELLRRDVRQYFKCEEKINGKRTM
jgi:hypothetical protein